MTTAEAGAAAAIPTAARSVVIVLFIICFLKRISKINVGFGVFKNLIPAPLKANVVPELNKLDKAMNEKEKWAVNVASAKTFRY